MQPRDRHPEKSQNNDHLGGSLSHWNAVDRLDKIFGRWGIGAGWIGGLVEKVAALQVDD
jgi:hypothetical protein